METQAEERVSGPTYACAPTILGEVPSQTDAPFMLQHVGCGRMMIAWLFFDDCLRPRCSALVSCVFSLLGKAQA